MQNAKTYAAVVATLFSTLLLAACGGGGSTSTPATPGPNCQPGTSSALNPTCTPDFAASTATPGSVQVTFSGETLGVAGLPFQPVTQGDPVFVDGWSISFDEILVVVGNFKLAPGATQSPNWSTVQTAVATSPGPYVLDVHKPSGFVGKDGVEPAGAIFVWNARDDGTAFDTGTRYSFSYSTVKAGYPATQINLAQSQFADYDLMVQKGWSKLYRGTATYVGTGSYPDAAIQAKFDALPGKAPNPIHFSFGWNDGTGNLDCINPDFGDETDLANRGIQPTSSGAVIAQVTLHVDHAFWDILKQEGAPLRFDPIAAWAPQGTTAAAPFSINTLATKPIAATFSDGSPLPDRAPYLTQLSGTPFTTDQSNPSQVTLGLNGVPASGIAGLADYMAFSAQSQMHLNANGLCYIVGQNAADPFFVPAVQ